MKNKQDQAQVLSETLEQVDDGMLQQAFDTDTAEKFRALQRKKVIWKDADRPVTNFRRYATAAACLIFAISLALVVGSFAKNFHAFFPDPTDPTAPPLTKPPGTIVTTGPTVPDTTVPTIPQDTLPPGPYDPSAPPEAIVSDGKQSITLLRPSYRWTQLEGEYEVILSADAVNPLSGHLQETIPWIHVASLVLTPQFQKYPDSIMVRCWEISNQGNEAAYDEYQIATVSNRTIQLKQGSYIYEITAEWYYSSDGYGTVTYVFAASTSAVAPQPEMSLTISSGSQHISDAIACLEESWIYDDASGKWVIYSGSGGHSTLIYTDWSAADAYMPKLTLDGDLQYTLSEGGKVESVSVYFRKSDTDFGLKQADDTFASLSRLPAGQWYVILKVTWQGRYIEAQHAYESHNYDYLFQLNIPENNTEPGICGKDVTWTLNMNTGTLTISGTGDMYTMDHAPWYDYRHLIKKVVIEEGVTKIGGFSHLQQLVSVQIADSVTTIDQYAFSGCSSLTQIHLPDGVQTIGSYAFRDCYSLQAINIPESVTTVSWGMLSGCRALTSIALHDGITKIETDAFNGCVGLTQVTIPGSVTELGGSIFFNCSNLQAVALGSGITTITNHMFADCTSLTEIVLPDSVKTIDGNAFHGCSNLQNIFIGPNVETVSYDAFYGCDKLLGFQISKDNPYIRTDGTAIFNMAQTEVLLMAPGYTGVYEVPNGVTVIKLWSFANCALSGVILPDSVTEIEEYAFDSCANLETAILSKNLTVIGMRAFMSCKALKEITFPASVEKIEFGAFSGCTGLESATFLGKLPEIADYAFLDVTGYLYYPPHDEEWDHASQLPAPDMEWLPSICIGGHTIQILPGKPATCTEDGLKEGKTCSVCGELLLYQQVIPATGHVMGDWEYAGTSANTQLYRRSCANCGYTEEKSEEIPSYPEGQGSCGESLTWHFADGTLTISGSGTMEEYSNRNVPPWREFADGITKVDLPDGLTNISRSAFVGFVNLTEIQIPETVTAIGMQAFSECSSLTSLVIPDSVQTISSMAFFGCTGLKTVTIGTGITKIDMYAFQKCSALEEIHFTGGMPSMAEAFYGLTTTIYYPAGNSTWDTGKVSTYETYITWVAVEGSP